jgi:hypothetical protein
MRINYYFIVLNAVIKFVLIYRLHPVYKEERGLG